MLASVYNDNTQRQTVLLQCPELKKEILPDFDEIEPRLSFPLYVQISGRKGTTFPCDTLKAIGHFR